jgi:two-component system nitrogen regulation response regulator GlnG
LLERIAQRAGFDVDGARDGIEALEMMQRKQYDIAIIDLMMPRLSGYELVQKISEMNPRPCLIVASAATNGTLKSLDDTLVRRVIKKPFDIEAVAKALVETAAQIAEQRAASQAEMPVAPPETAKLPVAPEGSVISVSEECAPADAKKEPEKDQKPTPG